MTYQQALDLIATYIVTNGNNEITAAVANPVLVAIVESAEDTTGELSNLDTDDQSNLVAAINELKALVDEVNSVNGVMLYKGQPDPNVTPPATYKYADFYMQVNAVNLPLQLYQYTGLVWEKVVYGTSSSASPKSFFGYYSGASISVPIGFTVDVAFNLNNIDAEVETIVSGTSLTITSGVDIGERYFITGKYSS